MFRPARAPLALILSLSIGFTPALSAFGEASQPAPDERNPGIDHSQTAGKQDYVGLEGKENQEAAKKVDNSVEPVENPNVSGKLPARLEDLPEDTAKYSPSQLSKRFGFKEKTDFENFWRGRWTDIKTGLRGPLGAVPAGVATWYAAMGVTYVYMAYMEPETHPTALEDFKKSFNPMTAMAIGGFVLAAGIPYYSMRGAITKTAASAAPTVGEAVGQQVGASAVAKAASKSMWAGIPKFALGIGLGTIASQVIFMLASDQDVRQCLNLVGNDIGSCQKAYDRWVSLDQGDYILHSLGPSLSGMLIGTAAYAMFTRGGDYLFTKLGWKEPRGSSACDLRSRKNREYRASWSASVERSFS